MMDGIRPGPDPLGRFVDQLAAWSDSGIAIVMDLLPAYALVNADAVPRPYLIITGNSCPLYLHDLLRLEPEGLIAPGGPPGEEQIERAMTEIAAGQRVYLGPPLTETGLTARERDVVRLVALGLDNHDIARELAVAEKTVRNTISVILSKLGLKNRIQLCYYYLGILPVISGKSPG